MTPAQIAQRIKELRHALATISEHLIEELHNGKSLYELKETMFMQKSVIEELQQLEESKN